MSPPWTKWRKGRGIRSVFVGMNIWECCVVGASRMWWNTREWDGGMGEGCRANGCGVSGVTCGWRGGTLLQRGQMPHWLDFISHCQTPRSMPTSSMWAHESVWTSQPVNLHQMRRAVTLSWWVPPSLAFFHCFSLFRNLCSRAYSPLQQKEKKSCEKAREREWDVRDEERAAWHLAQCCIIGCGWCDQKRLQKYNTLTNHLSASSSYSCLSLSLTCGTPCRYHRCQDTGGL